MVRFRYLVAALLTFVLLPATTHAVVVCYDESRYPSVISLDKTETGLRALPGIEGDGTETVPFERSSFLYSESRGWEAADFLCKDWNDCNGSRVRGEFPGPALTLSTTEAVKLRPGLAHYWHTADGGKPPDEIEQDIRAWTEHDGAIWYGISFYDGEGTSGVGGIGRFDPKTKNNVVRRPPLLRDLSVFRIVHDGRWLWLGAGGSYECAGQPPSHGLMRYDWEEDRMETFKGREDGPCGFTVHDLLLDAKYLWVATDLGLSRRDRAAGTWEQFVPAPGASPPMQPTTCDVLYARLLEGLPREPADREISLRSQLFESLEKFRPRFLARYIDTLPQEKRGCDELRFLGESAPDYPAFKKGVLDLRPPTDPSIECAVRGFGANESRDPAWRDFLLARLDSPKQQPDILYLLKHFAPDAKIADVLVYRLATADNPWQEAELLPSMGGSKSVAVLMSALGRYRHEAGKEHIVESIVSALMTVTRTVISPDGKETKLLPGASPDICAFGCPQPDGVVLRAADHWIAWWGVHRHEFDGKDGSSG